MKITLLCVGKASGPVAPAIREYEDRVRRYWRLETLEVEAGEGKTRKADPDRVRRSEGERLLARLPDQGPFVALTREGQSMTSRALAGLLEKEALASTRNLTFVIGGAYGLSPEVFGRADRLISLSGLTLPHEVARLLLAEQLYRAGTILRNEPYHKGVDS